MDELRCDFSFKSFEENNRLKKWAHGLEVSQSFGNYNEVLKSIRGKLENLEIELDDKSLTFATLENKIAMTRLALEVGLKDIDRLRVLMVEKYVGELERKNGTPQKDDCCEI